MHLKKVVFYAVHCLRNLVIFGRLPYLLCCVHVPLHFADVGTCIKIFLETISMSLDFGVVFLFFASYLGSSGQYTGVY